MLEKGKDVTHSESSTSNLHRKKLKIDCWLEHELNSLCIGVQKHGCELVVTGGRCLVGPS